MMRNKKREKRIRKIRIGITISITALFVVYAVLVARWSWVRSAQEIWSFVLSVGNYFTSVIGFNNLIPVKINDIPNVPFIPFLPISPEEFKETFKSMLDLIFTKDNLFAYLEQVNKVMKVISKLLLPLICMVLVLKIRFDDAADRETENYGEDSKSLKKLKIFIVKIKPAFEKVKSYFSWLKETNWMKVWLLIWLVNINIGTVLISAAAYYFYFSVSFDVVNLYKQLYKLSLDIAIAGAALPVIGWLIIGYIVFDKLRKLRALKRLREFETRNAAFIEKLPMVVLITGKMGTSKTKMLTDFALTIQDSFRARQLNQIIEIEKEFPFFSWMYFGNEIKQAFRYRQIRSLASAKDFAEKKKDRYLLHRRSDLQLYGYEVEKYNLEYDNGIVVINLLDRLSDYARLMYMYLLQSVLSGNYSIRLEDEIIDTGKLPIWKNDYLEVPSVRNNEHYRHCHRVDFDTLRLGLTVDPDSDKAGAFECGIVAHTEMGKDYGNQNTNDGYKRTDVFANPKNDMMIARQKLARHPATVCYYPYYRYIGDEQRPESLAADVREVLTLVRSVSSSEDLKTIYMFLGESLLYDISKALLHGWYVRYRHNRADNDCISFCIKHLINSICHWYEKKTAPMTYNKVIVNVEDGTLDGVRVPDEYYLVHKKIHANRYATDCFVDVFEKRSKSSSWSLEDSPCFADNVATSEEVLETNSYFGNQLQKIKNRESADKDEDNRNNRRIHYRSSRSR